jgi:hypothetical protein
MEKSSMGSSNSGILSLFACCAMISTWLGCGTDQNLAPAQGKVTIDGRPLTSGRVQFAPVASRDNRYPGRPAYGTIQPDGTFVLGTHASDDGALIGKHRVTIYRRKPAADVGPAKSAAPPDDRWNFAILRLVGMDFEVHRDVDNDFPIELTADFVQKYGELDD